MVEVIDMDDLDVIRLAVVDNITKGRIARAGMKVKGKFGKGWRKCLKRVPDPSTGFPLVHLYGGCLKNRLKLEFRKEDWSK